jgi:hypothetical protein
MKYREERRREECDFIAGAEQWSTDDWTFHFRDHFLDRDSAFSCVLFGASWLCNTGYPTDKYSRNATQDGQIINNKVNVKQSLLSGGPKVNVLGIPTCDEKRSVEKKQANGGFKSSKCQQHYSLISFGSKLQIQRLQKPQ